jgi:hypothetical protein
VLVTASPSSSRPLQPISFVTTTVPGTGFRPAGSWARICSAARDW